MFSNWSSSNLMDKVNGIPCDFCDRVLDYTQYRVARFNIVKNGDKAQAINLYCGKPCFAVLQQIEDGELPCQLEKGVQKSEYVSVRKVHKSKGNKPKRGGKRD